MEECIYFKILKKLKFHEKNFNEYLNKNLLKNRKIYIHMNKKVELPNEFSEINKLDIIYKIEGTQYSTTNSNIIEADINKKNIKNIQENISIWLDKNLIDNIYICEEQNGIIEIDINEKQIIFSFILKPKYKILIISLIIISCIVLIGFLKFKIVIPKNNSKQIGIIDGAYTLNLNNVVYNKKESDNKEKTHGDNMLEFANNLSNDLKIYYYDATDINNKIDSNSILLGLEYMKEKGIKTINISLSSKKYSSEIEYWIKNNPEIKVYASYNNLENTFDYPAMYEGVIGSGKKSKIQYKENDIEYLSNEIIILPNIFKVYSGNSYLSLYDAIYN